MRVNNTAPTLWVFVVLLPFTAFIVWQASRSDPSVPAAVPEVDLHAARVEEAEASGRWVPTFLDDDLSELDDLAKLEAAGMITITSVEEKR